MNKILIPALLVATVMVAGMFAFAPVEQASTVHTSVASLQASTVVISGEDTTDVVALSDDDLGTITIQARNSGATGVPFVLQQVIVCASGATETDAQIIATGITVDGDALTEDDGGTLIPIDILDGDGVSVCMNVLSALFEAQTVPAGVAGFGQISSDGGNVLITFSLEELDSGGADADTITSVKVTAIAQGDATTLFVDAALD